MGATYIAQMGRSGAGSRAKKKMRMDILFGPRLEHSRTFLAAG